MKKLNFIAVLLLSVVLTTSCSKKDEIVAPVIPTVTPIITIDELMGKWAFYSFQVYENSTELTTPSEFHANGYGYGEKTNVMLSFEFYNEYVGVGIPPYKLKITNPYETSVTRNLSDEFVLKNNVIDLYDQTKFKIISYNKSNKKLKIQMTKSICSTDPISCFYTIVKQ